MNLVRDLRPWMVVSALATASASMGQQAVEWKVSDGGNGHWYQVSTTTFPSWDVSKAQAEAQGGYLATISSSAENAFVESVVDASGEIDAVRLGGYSRPGTGWFWIDGSAITFFDWGTSDCSAGPYPNNSASQAWVLGMTRCSYGNRATRLVWDDEPKDDVSKCVIEWSTDCNGDGVVDYGQILAGELADSNGNGVPDCCETGDPCSAQNLLLGGGFEAGTPLAACASESAASPNTLAPGWQVSAGRVDRVRAGSACASSTQPKFGDYCVDLCGTPASSGAIRQVTATVPGHRYRCTFWLSGDASAGPAVKKMHAKVGTYVDLSYTFTCSGTGAQAWVSNQFEFTARGANETLEFAADNGVTTGGPMLDAVSLVDITSQCVGDLDGSGNVDGADIALLLLNFGDCTP